MIHHHIGNLFDLYVTSAKELVQQENLCPDDIFHIIVHGCNAQGKMGSGFAKELRSRFPGAYEEYANHYNTKGLKPGINVYHVPELEDEQLIITNSITQDRYGYDGKKYVSYDAIDLCMDNLNNMIGKIGNNVHVHFPTIGAELGGGNWNVIKEIIDSRIVNGYKHLYTLK